MVQSCVFSANIFWVIPSSFILADMILAIICEWLNQGFSSWLICAPVFWTGDIVSFIILDVFRFVPFIFGYCHFAYKDNWFLRENTTTGLFFCVNKTKLCNWLAFCSLLYFKMKSITPKIASLVARYSRPFHLTSPHPERNTPCGADLLLPYIRLSSVLPFLQSLLASEFSTFIYKLIPSWLQSEWFASPWPTFCFAKA